MTCAILDSTKVDVAKLSIAPNTLWLYLAASACAQDHLHPIAGRALPLTRWRRIASRKCEELLQGDVNLVFGSSTSCSRFSDYSLVWWSQTVIATILHCKLTNRLVVKTCTMYMNNEVHSTLLNPLAPRKRRGELIVASRWQWPLALMVGKPYHLVMRGLWSATCCRGYK